MIVEVPLNNRPQPFPELGHGIKEPFLEGLWDVGLKHGFDGGVWPTAQVRPEELETEGPVFEDAAAFISRLAKPRKN
jgi:hypothetical protein